VWLIRKSTGGRVTVRKLWQVIRLHRLGIDFNSLLWLGEEYTLILEFSGQMSRTGGYILGGYTDVASHHPQWVAVTQLSPDLANTLFPCFEDTSHLSPVVLNLAHTRTTRVVSITRVRQTSE